MKRFESKKDRWIVFVLWGAVIVILFTSFKLLTDSGVTTNLLLQPVNLLTIYICLSVLYQTYYIINGEYLILRSGPIVKRIRIDDITAIKETKDMLSSPALSIDRLKIIYKQSKVGIMVSPLEKELFLRELGFDPDTFNKLS